MLGRRTNFYSAITGPHHQCRVDISSYACLLILDSDISVKMLHMLEIFINQGLPLSMPYITYLIQEMVYYLKLVGLYVKLHTLRLIRIV